MNDNFIFCKKGSYLYVEGDEDIDHIFIIQKGRLQLTYSNTSINDMTKNVGPGDIIGFTSALSNRPRTESALAIEDTSVIVLTKDGFLEKTLQNPDMAFRIINYFAKQLREYNDLITRQNKLEQKGTIPENLFQNANFYYKLGHFESAYYIFSRLLALYPNNPMSKEATPVFEKIRNSGLTFSTDPQYQGIYRTYEDKQVIFCEDEPGDELFIIRKGRVKIVRQSENIEMILNVLREGDIFGELAIVSQKPRNATAISIGTTTILPINQDSLSILIHKSPMILKRIFTAISNRVWFTHTRLDMITYHKQITKIYVFLKNKLIEENVSLQSVDSHTFSFGIDELWHMINAPVRDDETENEILNDSNFRFNLGHITVMKPKLLIAKAHNYVAKDNDSLNVVEIERNDITTLNLNELMSQPITPIEADNMALEDSTDSVSLEESLDGQPISPLLKELDEFNDFTEQE